MDGRVRSLEGNKYAQVFAKPQGYFSKIYPMNKKGEAGDALRTFCLEFGVPEHLTFDGSKEQCGRKTEFMKQVRKNDIQHKVSEKGYHNQNPVEGVIRELRRKWYRVMVRKRVPPRLWDYGMKWVSEVNSLTYTNAGGVDDIPLCHVSGDTPDISEYIDFGFYDKVMYYDNAGLGPRRPGRWLGVSHRTGNLMSYHILTRKGKVVSRSSVQRVTELELQTTEFIETFKEFDQSVQKKIGKKKHFSGEKVNVEDWGEFASDPVFVEEFQKIHNDPSIPEADETADDMLNDTYLNMELALPKDANKELQFAKVTKRLRDANGLPIGTANDNPMLDTRMYEVEYLDGYKQSISANELAINLFSNVDQEGNRYVLFSEIIDHRTDGSEVKPEDGFITSSNGGRRKKETTKGWEILVRWKDGSSSWEALKDVKACYPTQLTDYAVAKNLMNVPAFAWWCPHVIKKRKRIVGKIKSKYWTRTHKFGIKIPKSIAQAKKFDEENGNTLWWDAIVMEMKNIRIAFEEFDGEEKDLPPGYQFIRCHMIFDVKMGEGFRRKARMVAGGHMTTTPASLTYSSVVTRDSVRIAFLVAALNDLNNGMRHSKCISNSKM